MACARLSCVYCCVLAAAAGLLDCTLEAANTGNVRLSNFSLGEDAVSCRADTAQTLLPGASVRCTLRTNVTAEQLAAAGQLPLNYKLTVTPAGPVKTLQDAPLETSNLQLDTLIGASPACSSCRSCMQATRTFVQSQGPDITPTARATAFGSFCAQNEVLKQSPLCSKVQADIAASTFGNLGRRAAGLCFALDLCDRRFGTSCSMQVAVNSTAGLQSIPVSTASMDVCSGKQQ